MRLKPFLVVSEAPIASLVIFERDAAPATLDEALAFLAPHLADAVSFGTAEDRAAAVDAVWARFAAAHETGAARAG